MHTDPGIDFDQYKTQAKDLLKQVRAATPDALARIRAHHPEHATLALANIRLSDTQLVIARINGFPSWARFKEYVLFRGAVHALDSGDAARLETLLVESPWLVRYRCRHGEWYEQGYFAGATLLNHVAGNPIRRPIPANIQDIAHVLLRHGAGNDTERAKYTIGLLLTSKQASEAGVALPLIDLLLASTGATLDFADPAILNDPLRNHAPATAEALIRRGAHIDIRHAAALGRLDLVQRLVMGVGLDNSLLPLSSLTQAARLEMENAFIDACLNGHIEIAEYLLDQGVDPGTLGSGGQTGMHFAAHAGKTNIVARLIERGVPLEIKNMYGGTVLGQTIWSAINEPRPEHFKIIETLVDAGADTSMVGYPTGDENIDALLR